MKYLLGAVLREEQGPISVAPPMNNGRGGGNKQWRREEDRLASEQARAKAAEVAQQSPTVHDINKASKHGLSSVANGADEPWKEYGLTLKPCWQKPAMEETNESKISDAVVVARYLKTILVIPEIRGSNTHDYWTKWEKPQAGTYKLNVDGSYKDNQSTARGILRNEDGLPVFSFWGKVLSTDPETTEVEAINLGLDHCYLRGISNFELETDSMAAAKAFYGNSSNLHLTYRTRRHRNQHTKIKIILREQNSVADLLAKWARIHGDGFADVITSSPLRLNSEFIMIDWVFRHTEKESNGFKITGPGVLNRLFQVIFWILESGYFLGLLPDQERKKTHLATRGTNFDWDQKWAYWNWASLISFMGYFVFRFWIGFFTVYDCNLFCLLLYDITGVLFSSCKARNVFHEAYFSVTYFVYCSTSL
ncbi:hypothetical protein CASFOL_030548 [Castilleja foliolosa]|uniref:RNase H type-1 domain-containing protein n=1 Tax=Castilleja foliolosa TaxID=1961234 RepID=A0ABD3C720_9LAMI